VNVSVGNDQKLRVLLRGRVHGPGQFLSTIRLVEDVVSERFQIRQVRAAHE
jgi:hypothetical protein